MLELNPTGAAWWVAQVDAGLVSGRLHRHGDPSTWIWGATRVSLDLALQGYTWIWDATRVSLDLALQGYTVKTARRTACPGP